MPAAEKHIEHQNVKVRHVTTVFCQWLQWVNIQLMPKQQHKALTSPVLYSAEWDNTIQKVCKLLIIYYKQFPGM